MRFWWSYIILIFLFFGSSCTAPRITFKSPITSRTTGDDFYESVLGKSREERENIAKDLILSGNVPDFLTKFTVLKIDTTLNGKHYKVKLFVTSDYLSVGTNSNFARIPLTPKTAQQIADSFHCFLPTKTIVDYIYQQARVKLAPVPMYAFRDSSVTMYHHHLIIEGQRKLKKGLIAGIKKDVVITSQLKERPDKVAIYGWHKLDGKPIQPIFTGHIWWYVDYSHGIRLIYEYITVNGKRVHYRDILKDPVLKHLITDESIIEFFRYSY
ncbi:MAG: hypothetical protein J5I50_11910 [Chitinophagaceae bacterium]|nr:hypothetical protein [Chitinophagaceae bacterium]